VTEVDALRLPGGSGRVERCCAGAFIQLREIAREANSRKISSQSSSLSVGVRLQSARRDFPERSAMRWAPLLGLQKPPYPRQPPGSREAQSRGARLSGATSQSLRSRAGTGSTRIALPPLLLQGLWPLFGHEAFAAAFGTDANWANRRSPAKRNTPGLLASRPSLKRLG
jgi:hypothetical protein